MQAPAGARALRGLLVVTGVVMVVAGAASVVAGARLVPNEGIVTPDVDTELRFYAVWYVVAGILLLRAAPRAESEAFTIRLVGAGFFVAGCARALSWLVVGRPHAAALILMTIELVWPLVVVPWQASLAPKS